MPGYRKATTALLAGAAIWVAASLVPGVAMADEAADRDGPAVETPAEPPAASTDAGTATPTAAPIGNSTADPGADPASDPASDPGAAPASDPGANPGADRGADPANAAAETDATPGLAAACAEAELLLARLACRLEAAQQADDPTLCLDGGEPPVVFNCLGRFAEEAGDPAACDLMPEIGGAPAATLRDACRAGVAVATEDPALCEALEEESVRLSCLLLMVQRTGDAALCDRLEDEAARQVCRQQE